jgi:fumarylacetoacetase
MNETHDPGRTSWVQSAVEHPEFPIQNLPYGVFRRRGSEEAPAVGIAIGDEILNLAAVNIVGGLTGPAAAAAHACTEPTLNALMALGPEHWTALRSQVSALLASESALYRSDRQIAARILVPMNQAELFLPAQVGDYTDFYASVYHATNVGSMFRPDNPLLPNYKWVPIGYHGRASTIVLSGTTVRRPFGQVKDPASDAPVFRSSSALDYEMEIGCFVGPGNPMGESIPIDEAEQHLFGLCLVNDWSARDIQSWEYQPLGPFLAKSFATSISPWVVSMEALEPFRVPAFKRPAGDPEPLAYLDWPEGRKRGGLDLTVEVYLTTDRMRAAGTPPHALSRASARDLYWTLEQMLAHHTSNGCSLRPGDLFATGTVSGPTKGSRGCMLELSWRGSEPITLPTGETRKFLEDGDEVIMRAFCERPGAARIGFGECRGKVIPANQGLSVGS